MFGLFGKNKNSGNVAKERLKLVLVDDRSNSSSEFLEKVKHEIFDVLSKHMDFDEREVDIKINRHKDTGRKYELRASIPYKKKR